MKKNNPVVACLQGPPFSYPYSSIALSSDGSSRINNGSYAVVAGKDTLRVLSLTHNGVNEIRSIRVSKCEQNSSFTCYAEKPKQNDTAKANKFLQFRNFHFHASQSNMDPLNNNPNKNNHSGDNYVSSSHADEKNTFDLRNFQHLDGGRVSKNTNSSNSSIGNGGGKESRGTNVNTTVTITDVAWSHTEYYSRLNNLKNIDTSDEKNGNIRSGASGDGGGFKNIDGNNDGIEPFNHHNYNQAVAGVGDYSAQVKSKSANEKSLSTHSSLSQHFQQYSQRQQTFMNTDTDFNRNIRHQLTNDSIVAAAGSNGVVVAWHAETALLGDTTGISVSNDFNQSFGTSKGNQGSKNFRQYDDAAVAIGQPEAVLAEHSRAVNRLAWHRRRSDLLLTASQDATVKLWDRRASSTINESTRAPKNIFRSWFGFLNGSSSTNNETIPIHRSIPSWCCASTYQPKCDAVRDICWSPFIDEAFAIVTESGILAVYDMRLTARPWTKLAAHTGEATTVDWHPTRPYVIATGGGRDRSVKIWDIQSGLSSESGDFMRYNSNFGESNELTKTIHASTDNSSSYFGSNAQSAPPVFQSIPNRNSFSGINPSSATSHDSHSISSYTGSHRFPSKGSHLLKRPRILSISAPITRVKWRPPSQSNIHLRSETSEDYIDHHDAMLAVATAPISGTNSSGAGSIELWSYHRPFMALSVVEGHHDGAVTDFIWIDTPTTGTFSRRKSSSGGSDTWGGNASVGAVSDTSTQVIENFDDWSNDVSPHENTSRGRFFKPDPNYDHTKVERSYSFSGGSGINNDVLIGDIMDTQRIWQHVLSVGRDGRCLLQNLERGERPISQVPRSNFALASLSPFQSGSGSLQIMSVHQNVPSGKHNDFALTRLRRDSRTARCPGVFSEISDPPSGEMQKSFWYPKKGGQREPAQNPQLAFSVIDPGNLCQPVVSNDSLYRGNISVAPELVHVSRFAKSYRLKRDASLPTRYLLCMHNSDVAERWFGRGPLSRMWKILGDVIAGTNVENLTDLIHKKTSKTENIMSSLIFPILKNLLLERANAGDVQTCVAICEVVGVFLPRNENKMASENTDRATLLPDIDVITVREWYFSYIEILQQMCLFSQASELINSCEDPEVAALNQQSTTIHMTCPCCGKPLEGATVNDGYHRGLLPIAQRACGSCRRRIGMCFICHTPVKGVYVYCPGCGHGGHLEHALEWFGGIQGRPVRELCPTGCGHKCNRLRQISGFPKTMSLMGSDDKNNEK